jgi:hypothetical protein
MSPSERVPMVRCRLDGGDVGSYRTIRYVPLGEFGLWRYLMETRHGRSVSIEEVSFWVAEDAARWNSGFLAEDLEPVLRIRFERQGPQGWPLLVERYFPAETYPEAQEALLHHYERGVESRLRATAGYFVPVRSAKGTPTPV